MRNLGKWKKPISRIFVVSASAGSFLSLVQPFYVVCSFYHILLFYLSHAYTYFLCYALLYHFVIQLVLRHLCGCFVALLAVAFVYPAVFLCGHGLVCFCQNLPRMLLYGWLLTAYNANYKDLWRYPVKPYRAIGPWIVLNVLCRFKYHSINRRFHRKILLRYLPGSHPVQRP